MNKNSMTPEVRNKLVGLLPCSTDFTVEFTPDIYKDEELGIPEKYWPKFILKPWTAKEVKQLATLGNDEEKAIEELRKKIVGWINVYKLDDGIAIPYESEKEGGVKLELLDLFPLKVLLTVLNEVTRISGVTM